MNKHLFERVSYLKGLLDGANISKDSKEGILFHNIINILDDFAAAFEDLEENQIDLEESIYELEDAVSDIEDEIYDDFDEEELVCPSCGEEVFVDTDTLYDQNEEVFCPVCDEVILPSIKSDLEEDFDI